MIQAYLLSVCTIIVLSHEFQLSHAFAGSSSQHRTRTTVTSSFQHEGTYSPQVASKVTAIFASQGYWMEDDNGDDDDEDDLYDFDSLFDLDLAREQLESLVGAGGIEEEISKLSQQLQSQQPRNALNNIRLLKEDHQEKFVVTGGASIASSPSMMDVVEPPPLSVDLPHRPPLTSIERERRLAEIRILENLRDNDDAIADLWALWFAERGAQAEAILKEADELMSGRVRQQLEAERLLRSLIEEYGVYFVEPVNRLATLYFQQGRMEESLALNKIVLAVKPWHVGALSHIVMVYEALGDSMSARSWARFRLPSGSINRRAKWSERAINDAIRMLEQGEVSNSMSFGESDSSWVKKQPQFKQEDNAWQ
jgi:tetratricopeptide (TPR) repeat protein